MWVLLSISLAYNAFDFVTSNETLSEQLNYVSSQTNTLIQLQNDLSEFENRCDDLDRKLSNVENSLERNLEQINELEWRLILLQNEIQGEISNVHSEIRNHTFFFH